MKGDLMIITVNSLVTAYSLIDVNDRKLPTRYHCSWLPVKDQLIIITSMIIALLPW